MNNPGDLLRKLNFFTSRMEPNASSAKLPGRVRSGSLVDVEHLTQQLRTVALEQ